MSSQVNFLKMILQILFVLPCLLFLSGCGSMGTDAPEPPRPTVAAAGESPTLAAQVEPTSTSTTPPTPAGVAEGQVGEAAATPAENTVSNIPAEATTIEPTPTSTPVVLPSPTATALPTPPPEPAAAVQLPALDTIALTLIPVASGFSKPVHLTHAGDGSGRLFVVEQAGRILILKDGATQPAPFLDIISLVGSSSNEQGLLSVAFHPDYSSNGLFFVNYTNKDGDTVIARYQVSDNPDQADPSSAQILLTIPQPYPNHNGGQIAFGPDGYLYIGMGDGGAANDPQNRAQTLSELLGKILRLDVDNGEPYGIPETNPFVGNEQARPEIWSYGWRNPWRFSFDPATNDLYVADVGQNQYEEVHVERSGAPGGQNYGWRLMEGVHCHIPQECDPAALGLVLPVAEYDHGLGCSITGGYVYRGTQFPDLNGIYFYGDYCSGIIWGLRAETDGTWSQAEMLRSQETISSFGQDQAGEVYLIDHQGDIFQMGH